MVKIIGLGKFVVGAVCLSIYLNGLNTTLTTDGSLIVATIVWFGAAVGCFAWGIKDVQKARKNAFKSTLIDLGTGDGKIVDLSKKGPQPDSE